jgi:hypothetical protein
MNRMVPNALLSLLEFWFSINQTCVRWGNIMSDFINLECGVRQGGVLSPHLFAIFIDDIIKKLEKTDLGCRFRHKYVGIIIYADDILLLAPSIEGLQAMLHICENELALLDVALNAKKSLCIRVGPRYNASCNNIATKNGESLSWVNGKLL